MLSNQVLEPVLKLYAQMLEGMIEPPKPRPVQALAETPAGISLRGMDSPQRRSRFPRGTHICGDLGVKSALA